MRGCAFVLVLAAGFALAVAWFGSAPLAAGLIQVGLAGSGFEAASTDVHVTSEPPFEVLGGRADRVDIGADGARFGRIEATRVDLALLEVDLFARSFRHVDGLLTGTRARNGDRVVPIGRVELSGAASDAVIVVTIGGEDVERAAEDALNDALGLPIVGAELSAPDVVRVGVAGQAVDVRLVVEPGGSLSLAAPLPGNPRVPLVDPDPLVLRSVTVVDGELILIGTLDVARLLGT